MKFQFDIQSYLSQVKGFSKQYLFYINLVLPTPALSPNAWEAFTGFIQSFGSPFGLGAGEPRTMIPYLVKATALPDSMVDEILIPAQHFEVKIPGIVRYTDWTVTFNVDKEGVLLQSLYNWQNLAHSVDLSQKNDKQFKYMEENYMQDQQVFLLDGTGEAQICYKLFNAWPKSIQGSQFDYSSEEVSTIDVTFSFWYYTIENVKIGSLKSLVKQLSGSLTERFL